MRLIVTEKNNSASKIADILSGGDAKEEKSFRVPYYTWTDSEGAEQTTIGLKGHVLNPAFPETYKSWQDTDPRDLIDAELIKQPTDKNVVKAIRKVAEGADDLIIATDFDREGELIGLEALQEIVESNPALANGAGSASAEGEIGVGVKRARYSALTKEEIERAFSELDELSMPLANAGAARQDIDLIWGATLTRAVSRATRRFGSNFLSVGRVQSPTLGLVVERELERRAHKPEPFWEVLATFAHADGSFEAHHETDKFWKEEEAKAAVSGTTNPGKVTEIASKRQTRKPPAPLNTTAFTTDCSSRLSITPARAMRIAENLYMDGFISYPRTDNTVYPKSLPLKELVSSLVRIPDFESAAGLLDGPLEPTRGKKETTDHPPIYPTQAVHPKAIETAHDTAHRRVYELVARRFLATFSPPMVSESTRADIEAGSESYFVRGSVVIDPGYAGIYTYARSPDEELPKLEQGQELPLEGDPELIAKETQPPSRISQGKLIELMEERGLGTKATRADIIQKLYDRGYVHGNPPEPSETGVTMYEGFKRYVPRIATPDMTAEMEAEMDQIAKGEMTKDQVLSDSRDMLRSAYDEVGGDVDDDDENSPWRQFAKLVWGGMDADRILGPCIVCREAGRKQEDGSPNMLRVIRARKSGKSFVGCSGWNADAEPGDPSSCDQTFPMPQPRFYDVFKFEDTCSICGRTPRVQVSPRGRRGRPWKLCFNEECPSMQEMKRKKAEREAAKKAKEEADAAKAAAEGKIAAKDGEATEEAEKVTAKASKNGAKAKSPAQTKSPKGENGAKKKAAPKKKAPSASTES
jgi:DNA topoisomerase I